MCLFAPFLNEAQSIPAVDSTNDRVELMRLEWEIFNSIDNKISSELLLNKSSIQLQSEDYHAGLESLNRINLYGLDPGLRNEILNQKILLYYLSGQYGQVKNAILETTLLEDYVPNEDIKLLEILNLVALKEFEEARILFKELNPTINDDEVFDVKKLRKENKALNMSILFPGSGQIYAGYYFKGLSSLGIQAIFFTYGIKGLQDSYFFTQALPSIGLFYGFYFGGAEYAKELVRDRNQKILNDLSNNIIDAL